MRKRACGMKKIRKNRSICVVVGGLCSIGWLSSAIASPPVSRVNSAVSTIESVRALAAATRTFVHPEHAPTPLLDLGPLSDSPRPAGHSEASVYPATVFPSGIHHLALGASDLAGDDRIQMSAMGAGEAGRRTISPMQAFASRVHREGVPIARLWESKSALLSLGLNQRGKPGLWLFQKIR
jgi:hypothetical protein